MAPTGPKYAPASVAVAADLSSYNHKDEWLFIHNLSGVDAVDIAAGDSTRDVKSHADFWVIQIYGAYEHREEEDNDAPGEDSTTGHAMGTDGPTYIFVETLRDEYASHAQVIDFMTYVERTVLHETAHRFITKSHEVDYADLQLDDSTSGIGDEGPLNGKRNAYGSDAMNSFTLRQLAAIQRTDRPK